jgi:A/G-specific adenine glycosylase
VARLACALAEVDGALVLVRRAPDGLLGGLWDLPAADVTGVGATSERAALRRALRARFGPRVAVGELLGEVTRTLTHRSLTLRAFACEIPAARAAREELRLAPSDGLARLGISAATRALLETAGWPARSSRAA